MTTKNYLSILGILLTLAGCNSVSEKQTAPFVPRNIVQYPEESVYSGRITKALDEQYERTAALLKPRFPNVRSATEVALSDEDIRVAIAWHKGYFAKKEWQKLEFKNSPESDQLFAWKNGDMLFAVRIIKPAADFNQSFLQYYIQGMENPS
jgi:hypothetical protein